MLKHYPPLMIRPLTLRGVFGITNKLLRRRTGTLLGYHALYVLFTLLLTAPSVLVMVFSMLSLEKSTSDFSSSFSSSASEVFSFIGGFFGSMFLIILASLAVSLLLTPIVSGTIYSEMTARVYGQASSLSQMLRRSKYSLKRFFTTTLCNMLSAWGISFAVSLVTGLLAGVVLVFAVIGSIAALAEGEVALGAGAIITFIFVYLLVLALAAAAGSLLSFVFPVAVNEPVRNFAAVGRSIKLVWKRLGRVVGCTFILCGIAFLIAFISAGAMAAADFLPPAAAAVVLILASLLYIALIMFLSLYQPALATVLYFDARARLEGTSFPPFVQAQPAVQVQPVVETQPVVEAEPSVEVQPVVEVQPSSEPSAAMIFNIPDAPAQEDAPQDS